MLRVLNQRNQPVEIYLGGSIHYVPPLGELLLNLDEKNRETLCSMSERLHLHIELVENEPAKPSRASQSGAAKRKSQAGKKPKRRKKNGV